MEALLRFIQPGDHINVYSIDRLARNLKDLRMLIDEVTAKKCSIQFHQENLLFTGKKIAFQDLILNMLGAVVEFEPSLRGYRQSERKRGSFRKKDKYRTLQRNQSAFG
ncbi:recombinase family protein [Vibrio alginolyticus]|uniref:recombinase family protein n=1 Tax=Vibrio alginolyticus TaxID=663 RepID=UPI002119C39B|nr:recombinase family protein [Vibrio alginolyticus]